MHIYLYLSQVYCYHLYPYFLRNTKELQESFYKRYSIFYSFLLFCHKTSFFTRADARFNIFFIGITFKYKLINSYCYQPYNLQKGKNKNKKIKHKQN
jgi:hypothetical protein